MLRAYLVSSRCLVQVLLLLISSTLSAQITLVPNHIILKKGIDLNLYIPQGYHISVAAEGMKRLRFLTKGPDGQLFATDLNSLADNRKGRIYLFRDWDNTTKSYQRKIVFAQGLHNPNQILFYNDKGINYIYIAETDKLSRYEYHTGDSLLKGRQQVLAQFPAQGLDYKYGGWHLTRSLAQHKGKIYVSVGSSCNACLEKEEIRATIMEMNPDGTGEKLFASGVRNAVVIKWLNEGLWGTFMGRDLLGADKPEDLFGNIEQGKNYGWPWYYQYQQRIYADKTMMDSAKNKGVLVPVKPPLAFCGFMAHSAPLGFDQFTNFNDPLLTDNFLVALHGSTTVSRKRGNAIVMVIGKDKYMPVVTGFLTGNDEKRRLGRPCDVMMNDANSFFFTDDKNGVLYYVWK